MSYVSVVMRVLLLRHVAVINMVSIWALLVSVVLCTLARLGRCGVIMLNVCLQLMWKDLESVLLFHYITATFVNRNFTVYLLLRYAPGDCVTCYTSHTAVRSCDSLPLTVCCFSKIQIDFTFLVPADPGNPEQNSESHKTVLCVFYQATML